MNRVPPPAGTSLGVAAGIAQPRRRAFKISDHPSTVKQSAPCTQLPHPASRGTALGGAAQVLPNRLAGQPADVRLGTLVTRGRFRVAGSPSGQLRFVPAVHLPAMPRQDGSQPRRVAGTQLSTTSSLQCMMPAGTSSSGVMSRRSAHATQSATPSHQCQHQAHCSNPTCACAPGHSSAACACSGTCVSVAAGVTGVDPALLLDGVCRTSEACSRTLHSAAGMPATTSPVGSTMSAPLPPTGLAGRPASRDSLPLLLAALEARRDALTEEKAMLALHNRMLREWLAGSRPSSAPSSRTESQPGSRPPGCAINTVPLLPPTASVNLGAVPEGPQNTRASTCMPPTRPPTPMLPSQHSVCTLNSSQQLSAGSGAPQNGDPSVLHP